MLPLFGGPHRQEVIKIVSRRGVPLLNVMIYDSREGSAVAQPVLASVEELARSEDLMVDIMDDDDL